AASPTRPARSTARPSWPSWATPTASGALPGSAATASARSRSPAATTSSGASSRCPRRSSASTTSRAVAGPAAPRRSAWTTAKGAQHYDLKEFWHVGREIPRDSKYAPVMPPNVWPAEVPDFREKAYGLYQALDAVGSQVLGALALHIDLPEDWFADKTDCGNSILRP